MYIMAMNSLELAVFDALLELENAVRGIKAGNRKADLPRLIARIDESARQLPPETAPELRHYLDRKSYQKARLFLEGRDTENTVGSCS
jgi:hypothetical protein